MLPESESESESEEYAAPFYLLRSSEGCWKCGTSCRVVALASGDEEPFMLSSIESMPEEFLLAITAVHPDYELRYSQMAGTRYFMNTCKCGAHFGDFFLFSEPGGAFFPTEDEEAAEIEVIELPFKGNYVIACSPGMGTGGLILQHGRRVDLAEIK
jgi:hypothetical protein